MEKLGRYCILGVNVDAVDVEYLHQHIANRIHENCQSLILNVNVHCLNLTYTYRWFRDLLNSADLVFCDGVGVIWGARLLGYMLPVRITYADWIWQLSAFARDQQFSMFFLGSGPGIAEKARDYVLEAVPDVSIVGTHHGYFNKDYDHPENLEIIEKINATQPDILIVGFGMPLQEQWLEDNLPRLKVKVALAGGAYLDYASGTLRRAPRWMTANNLEWFGRMLIEPRRLWRRYLLGNPLFIYRVLKQRFGIENLCDD